MSRIRKISLIIALLTTFIFCSFIIYFSLSKSLRTTNTPSEPLCTVIVAVSDIKANSIITAKDVATVSMPEKYRVQGTFSKYEDIVGKLSKDNIYTGEQIVGRNLYSSDTPERFSVSIPQGQRAITMRIDAVNGLAGSLQVGDFIDISALFKPPYKETETVETIFQSIVIMDFKQSGDSYLITFCMKPEDVNKLVLLEEISKLRISLRNLSDKDAVPINAIDAAILK